MPASRIAVLWLVTSSLIWAQSDIEKLGIPYSETLEGATATLTYWPTETGADLLFKLKGPGTMEVQCRLLDTLLGRVLKDHATESKFGVALGPMQDTLMEPLQRFLMTAPGWNSLQGRPRRQRPLGAFMTEAVNKSGILDPVAKVFARHGFSLSARGMSRIDIGPVPSKHDARLPLYIWQMNFVAQKR